MKVLSDIKDSLVGLVKSC